MRRYAPGAAPDETLVWYEGAGTADRRWLLTDPRGSIIAVANAAGTVTNVNKYDESGAPGAGNLGRFQFTGQMWLAEAGLYHYKARQYNPVLGRFMQTDPIGYGDGMNLYAYAGNDPVNATDPTGRTKVDVELPLLINKQTTGHDGFFDGFGGFGGAGFSGDVIVVTGVRNRWPIDVPGQIRTFINDLCRTTGCGRVFNPPLEIGGDGSPRTQGPNEGGTDGDGGGRTTVLEDHPKVACALGVVATVGTALVTNRALSVAARAAASNPTGALVGSAILLAYIGIQTADICFSAFG